MYKRISNIQFPYAVTGMHFIDRLLVVCDVHRVMFGSAEKVRVRYHDCFVPHIDQRMVHTFPLSCLSEMAALFRIAVAETSHNLADFSMLYTPAKNSLSSFC